jgi:hypothetical protein
MSNNLTDEQQQAQDHPPSWSEMFDHADPPIFQDQPQAPGPRSSAHIHANRRKAADTTQRQAMDLDVIEKAAQDEADDLALAKATRLRRDGKPVPDGIAARAARAARARGTSMSSAEIMAENFNRGRS